MTDILRIDMGSRTHRWESMEKQGHLHGGRALTLQLVHDEVPPTAYPLSRQNKLVIAPGLLSGTAAANSGRISVGAKSPLTGGIKESNSGGLVSQKLARLGIGAVVFEDKPEAGRLYLIVVRKGAVEILSTDDRLPDMFRETLRPHDTTWDFTADELQQVKRLGSGNN